MSVNFLANYNLKRIPCSPDCPNTKTIKIVNLEFALGIKNTLVIENIYAIRILSRSKLTMFSVSQQLDPILHCILSPHYI